MTGFAPAETDYSSTGTFDQGGPIDVVAPLTCRVLPPTDWARLTAIEPFKTHGLPDDPNHWVVLVVERAGAIVGTCSLFTAAHWDCWWIDPDEAGTSRGLVLRQLLREALTQFRQADVQQVYTGVEDTHPEVVDVLTRFGFTPVGGQLFLLRIADASMALRTE
jgi:hypothetical protein